MKKLIVSLVLAMAPAMAFAHQYNISTVIDADGGRANDVNVGMNSVGLAYDSLGIVGMCYVDAANNDLKFGLFDGNAWSFETTDNGGATNDIVGKDCAILFDDDDVPHIVYHNDTKSDLMHAKKNGNVWVKTVVDDNAPSEFNGISRISIAKDSAGDIAVAYYVRGTGDLKYAKLSGGRWTVSTVQSDGDVGRYPSLAFTNRGNPAIAYQGALVDQGRSLMYITHDGTRWQAPEAVDNEKFAGSFNSLKLDSNNKPHIAYTVSDPNTSTYALYYINKVGRVWSERMNLALEQGPATGMFTQMAIDPQNNIFIIYVDQFVSALFPDVNYLKLTSLHFVDQGVDLMAMRTDRLAFSIMLDDYTGLTISVDDNHHLMAAWAEENGRNYDLVTAQLTDWSPAITLLKPDASVHSGRNTFDLQWLDFDPDSNARIRFTRRNANWDLVVLNETAREDDANTLTINLADIPAGDYAILAEISDDDFNMMSGSLAPNSLTVEARQAQAQQGQQQQQAPADQGNNNAGNQAGGAQQQAQPADQGNGGGNNAGLPIAGNAPIGAGGGNAQASGQNAGAAQAAGSGAAAGSSGSNASGGGSSSAGLPSAASAGGGCALIR